MNDIAECVRIHSIRSFSSNALMRLSMESSRVSSDAMTVANNV